MSSHAEVGSPRGAVQGTVGGTVTLWAGGGEATASGGSVVMTGVVDAGSGSDAGCNSSTGGRSSAGGADMMAVRPNTAVVVMGLKKPCGSKKAGKLGIGMKRGTSQSKGYP